MSILLLCLIAASLSYLIYTYLLIPAFLSPLSKIPNAHPTSAFFPTWIWLQRRNAREVQAIHAAHREKGHIVRLGPNELSVASLDGLRQIYLAGFEKDEWYLSTFMNFNTTNLVSMLQHKPHATQKRMLSHVYSKSYLQTSQDLKTLSRVLIWERFLPVLYETARTGRPINVLEFAQGAGTDFMSAYLFGLSNATDFLRDVPTREAYFHTYRLKSQQLPGKEGAEKDLEEFMLALCQAAEDYVQNPSEQTSSEPSTHPVVYSQLATQLARSPNPPPTPEAKQLVIASEMFDHLLAGHETSGITLTYLLHELSKRPALQAALRQELLTLSPTLAFDPTSDPSSQTLPTATAIDNLPLLNAILYETLRLYTATPAPQPRITPPSGATIDGFEIPAGVRVSTSAYCMHRNAQVYPDPTAFRPERWLHGEKGFGGTEEMRRWFWAFGSGGRMCLGSNFALMALKLITASIYTNFTTSIVDDTGIEQIDAYISGPKANRLILQFKFIGGSV